MAVLIKATGVIALLAVFISIPLHQTRAQDDASDIASTNHNRVSALVFQAAGPNVASIQSSIEQFRAAIGGQNNGNTGGQDTGRREINWDGGSPTNQTTTVSGNPFAGFQVTRGALFTTPDGTGFIQAPASADPALFPPGGLAGFFHNPTYGDIFKAFSPSRLFSAIGSVNTDVDFFVPGGGNIPATVSGFGAVFSDVDLPDGSGPATKKGNRHSSTLVQFFGSSGELLFSSFVPAAPGNGGQSFLGIVLPDARIARVRIKSGNALPGVDDTNTQDVVMMDDFIYGEPKPVH